MWNCLNSPKNSSSRGVRPVWDGSAYNIGYRIPGRYVRSARAGIIRCLRAGDPLSMVSLTQDVTDH
ncbi:hypothetical protein FAIPA1_270001 [Frankia sp. AiPs1]